MGYNGYQWGEVGDSLSLKNMLIGKYTHELDPKKRLTLPSKWRSDLGKKVVITNGLDNSLFVFGVKEWEIVAQKLAQSGFGNQDSRSFNRFILGNAFDNVILYQDACQRGREDGEVLKLLQEGLVGATKAKQIKEIHGEFKAIDTALDDLSAGDICLILIDQVEESLAYLKEKVKP